MTIAVKTSTTITLERDALLAGLAAVTRVVERRNTIAILANVLIRSAADGVHLVASDLDMLAEAVVAADVDLVADAAGITVPAVILHDIVRKFAAGAQVALSWTPGEGQATLRSGRSRITLQTLPESDFPQLDFGGDGAAFSLPAADLAALIDDTSFAISTEETRYYLNGIYLHVPADAEGKLRAVATDGHRLARRDVALPKGAEGMPGVIVPRKTVAEIRKLTDLAGKEPIAVDVGAKRIRVSAGHITLTSKLIDGSFPDYQRITPTNNDKLATLDRSELAAALDRVTAVASARGSGVKLAFGDSVCTLSTHNSDVGEAVEDFPADYDHDAIEIGFNGRYLAEVLATLKSDSVLVKLSEAGSPTIFMARADAPLLIILMPMRV